MFKTSYNSDKSKKEILNMKRILITGSNGMLGKELIKILDEKFELYGIDRESNKTIKNQFNIDLTDSDKVVEIIGKIKPYVIIHTAALINLDFCENNQKDTDLINIQVSGLLSSLCDKIIFISTDSVFDGMVGNYFEESPKNPINYYAFSKSEAEELIMKNNKNAVIIRTNIYGSNSSSGNSLFEWAYKELSQGRTIKGFNDLIFNPVYTGQLADAILNLIEKRIYWNY